MKTLSLCFLLIFSLTAHAQNLVSETVYVESPTDTDHDGVADRIYVSIKRSETDKKLASILEMSPYNLGGNNVPFHDVDAIYLPQDVASLFGQSLHIKTPVEVPLKKMNDESFVFANLSADSLGTGRSTGCPTVGDESEILAAKAVIDWLGGRARGFDKNGKEIKADWSNGDVGMTGVSYNGTLPIMVASTGVHGLKAIVPIAAISNWYDYYRANGLVVGPGGYIGEDADILGYYIVSAGKCKAEMKLITDSMGRENGDYTPFWQARNHLLNAKKFKAATFIVHGQSDWNVKQKNAIQLWEALEGVVPRRMILHRGGHGQGSAFNVSRKIQSWFARYLNNEDNGIDKGPLVEVENLDGSTSVQEKWPHELSRTERFYFSQQNALVKSAPAVETFEFTDTGKKKKLDDLMTSPGETKDDRLFFISEPLKGERLFTGTPKVKIRLAVKNRSAANLTIAVVQITKNGKRKIVTQGWADPQNAKNLSRGEKLVPGKFYDLSFDLEPKQMKLEKDSQIGILVASTDYDYTLRPNPGTILQVEVGEGSFIDVMLTPEN